MRYANKILVGKTEKKLDYFKDLDKSGRISGEDFLVYLRDCQTVNT
jgi:hypothetical protein